MNTELQKAPSPLFPRLLLHLAAANICFAFLAVVPIVICLIVMVIANDLGGPMFFPLFVFGVLMFAAVVTSILAGAVFLSDLLCRNGRVPVGLPPVLVFMLATGVTWLSFRDFHPAIPLLVGAMVTLAFVIHWVAISTVWFLPRVLFRIFRVQQEPVKNS